MTSDQYYADLGDRIGSDDTADAARTRAYRRTNFTVSGGQGTGRAAMPMSQGWAMYKRGGGSHTLTDAYGRERWLNTTGMRVYGECLRHITAGTQVTAAAMAKALGVCDQTVRRWVLKLTAWGLIGSATARGRYGGMVLFSRTTRDNLERYAQAARDRLRAAWQRKFQSDTHTDRRKASQGVELEWERQRRQRDDDIEGILIGRRKGGEKRVPCPAHEGTDRNLSFWRRPDGSLGVKCWSHQCPSREIKAAVVPEATW